MSISFQNKHYSGNLWYNKYMMISKKQVLFLSKLRQKKYREQHQKFLLENPKVIWEEFSNKLLDSVYVTEEFEQEHKDDLVFDKVFTVSNADMKKISSQVNPVGVVALFDMPKNKKFDFKNKNILVLDTIQDPGNMGTIIRTADWYGFNSILLNETCADVFNPKVVSSTMGSIFNVNIYSDIDFPNLMEGLKKNGYDIVASDLNGQQSDLSKLDKMALIIGNESKGISPELLEAANIHYKIPKHGQAESLNAAVATGILMDKIKLH